MTTPLPTDGDGAALQRPTRRVGASARALYAQMCCGGLSSGDEVPAGKEPSVRRARRTANNARRTTIPAAIVLARLMLGRATNDEGDPRLHDTAAHSLPVGAGASGVTKAVPPAVGDWDSVEPGTTQLTAKAARVTSSQRHLGATVPG